MQQEEQIRILRLLMQRLDDDTNVDAEPLELIPA